MNGSKSSTELWGKSLLKGNNRGFLTHICTWNAHKDVNCRSISAMLLINNPNAINKGLVNNIITWENSMWQFKKLWSRKWHGHTF